MAGTVTFKMGANSPFRTLDKLRRSHDQREQNNHLTDLWSEAWSEMIGEKLGINPADVRKRYEHHLRDEDQDAA